MDINCFEVSVQPPPYQERLGEILLGKGSSTLILQGGDLNGYIITGDLDSDGDVDRDDLNIILSARETPATGADDPRDLDGDGMITALDARKLTLLCTRSRCATE